MRFFSKPRTLSGAILVPSLFGTIITLSLAGSGAYVLSKFGLNRVFDDRLRSIQILFSENISQDVVTGANSEVYRKCKSFLEDPSVLAVQVRDAAGSFICDLKKEALGANVRDIRTPIYFNEAKTDTAATVHIAYSGDDLQRLLNQSLALLTFFILLAATIQFLIARGISQFLSRPISSIAKILRGGDISALRNVQNTVHYKGSVTEVSNLLEGTEELGNTLANYQEQLIKTTRQAAVAQFASQIVHDLRSPLAYLDSVTTSIKGLPEQDRISLRNAAARLRDFVGRVLDIERKSKETTHSQTIADATGSLESGEAREVHLISSLVDMIVSEKREQFQANLGIQILFSIDPGSYGLFSRIQEGEFKRALSNIINNSIEALDDSGLIDVRLSSRDTEICIVVSDTGKGIPPEKLAEVGTRGVTFGKKDGTGLGVFHAKATLQMWGGRMEIESELEKGTHAYLYLPKAPAPNWFVPEIKLKRGQTVVVVDDAPSIHQVWKDKFDRILTSKADLTIHNFSVLAQLEAFDAMVVPDCLFLVDYEFRETEKTGLDAIENKKLGSHAILVTSRYDDKQIRDRCERLNVQMVPKQLSAFVSVSFISDEVLGKIDAILIDNDGLTQRMWQRKADENNKRLVCFFDIPSFLSKSETIDLETPIYVDSELDAGARGEEDSKAIWDKGYKKIFLVTGFSATSFDLSKYPWIREVLEKKAPWAGRT